MPSTLQRNGEFLLGFLLMAFSAFVIVESLRMPYWEKDLFLMGPGFVPLLSGAALFFTSLAVTISAGTNGGWKDWKAWSNAQFRNEENVRLLVILALLSVFIFGLIGRVRFVVAVAVFHALIFTYLRVGGVSKIVICTIGATLLVGVALPKFFEMELP